MVSQVPSGHVATYGQISRLVGRCTARMVGYAMAALPDQSDVPWHRVINRKGEVSKRKDGPGDIIQRKLLELEGVGFDRRGRVNFRKVLWRGPQVQKKSSGHLKKIQSIYSRTSQANISVI